MSKNSLLLITSAVALLPTLAMGLVAIKWSVTNVPASGLTNITFPFSIANSPHTTGYYFAQQFDFNNAQANASYTGYTGLQPRPDFGGKPVIRAVFSSFINGTTTNDTNCRLKADNGPGASCAVEFPAPYADGYQLVVRNTNGTTWNGAAVDTTTNKSIHIGSWTLPVGTRGIKGSHEGFIEYFPWNRGPHTCASLPLTSMAFGVPTTTMIGSIGSLKNAYEYGGCVGMVAFKSQQTPQEVQVQVGFKLGS